MLDIELDMFFFQRLVALLWRIFSHLLPLVDVVLLLAYFLGFDHLYFFV